MAVITVTTDSSEVVEVFKNVDSCGPLVWADLAIDLREALERAFFMEREVKL